MIVDFPAKMTETSPSIVHEYCVVVKKDKEQQWNIPLSTIAKKHLKTLNDEELDRDWMLEDFFESIFVINLPSAQARLQKISKELHKIGTKDFQVFSAIYGKDLDRSIWNKLFKNLHHIDITTEEGRAALERVHQGQAGCYLSHYTIIKQMNASFESALKEFRKAKGKNDRVAVKIAQKKLRKYSRVLILEDDTGFGFLDEEKKKVSLKGVGKHLRKALKELPENWDMLYFIVNPVQPAKRVSPLLFKLKLSWCLNAYAINYRMYRPLIEHLKKIEDPEVEKIEPVDKEIALLHKSHKVYAIFPSIAFSHGGTSHITDKTWQPWQGQPNIKTQRVVIED